MLLDGIQSTALILLFPFLIFGRAGDPPNGVFGAAPIAAGLALGILGTLLVGRLVDRHVAPGVLQLLQISQAACILGLILGALCGQFLLLNVMGMLAVALARSVGPAKDRIRAEFIGPERRTLFNAEVRRYFLLVNEAVAALCTLTLSVIPARYWSLPLLLSLACIAASVAVASSLAAQAAPRGTGPIAAGEKLPRSVRSPLAVGLIVVGLLGLASALPTVGLAAWLSASHRYGPWLITVAGLVSLGCDFFFIRFLGLTLVKRPDRWRRIHRLGGLLMIGAALGTAAAVNSGHAGAQVALLLLAMLCATLAYSVSTMLAMEIQFGFGSAAARGRIASYTRVSSVAAMALASWLAPGVFLANWVCLVAILAAGVALCVVPGGLSAAWTSLAPPRDPA
ncbi:hypothetical protein [Mycetocola spongiae]|uniref:hypothetical protein n=1 Tax=Mycetocola spongiae TaxID=2859226 RepID=UPI001CF59460|nr:hypothetical protein [Mycetocola spongiae]UCR89398.1 hypothetical protein KXZ72_01440 [Mycetocola spongiae]